MRQLTHGTLGLFAAMLTAGHGAAADADALSDGPIRIEMTIEIAGGDDSDLADPKKLRDSGLPMIPDKPTASSRDPLAPAPTPEKTAAKKQNEEKTAARPQATSPAPETKPAEATAGSTQPQPAAPAAASGPAPEAQSPVASIPADHAYYLRLDTGFSLSQDSDASGRNGAHGSSSVDNAPLIGGGVGINLDPAVRLEGALTYRGSMDIGGTDGTGATVDGSAKGVDAMVNVYYDFLQARDWTGNDLLTPYVGAGVGLAAISTDDLATAGGASEGGETAYNLGYALMAGVAARLTETLRLDVGYRFVNMGGFEQNGRLSTGGSAAPTSYDDLLLHEVRAGLRFAF